MANTRTRATLLFPVAILAMVSRVSLCAGQTPAGEIPPPGTALPGYAAMRDKMAETDADSGASTTVPEGPDGQTDADSGATPSGRKPLSPDFFGIPVSVKTHRIVGYASGGLLLAGGAIGVARFLDLMERSHDRRDNGETDCAAIIREEWERGQALRWTHVGLVASGEALYLFDAATGISLMRKGGSPSRAGRIHRNAFFAHAALMVSDIVLGFLLTGALERGSHDEVVGYGAAHAGIGVAIPLVIIGSGLLVDLMPPENPPNARAPNSPPPDSQPPGNSATVPEQ